MPNQFSRTELLIGKEAIEKLNRSRVAVFGVGGVGGYVVEALVRSGLGNIDIIDNDEVCLTNLNRQIIATHSTIGMAKVDAMEKRIKDINPDVNVVKHKVFYTPKRQREAAKQLGNYAAKSDIDEISQKQQTDTILSPYRHIALSPHDEFDFTQYDYVVDAIDTVVGKLSLIEECKKANTPIICAMGAGNKMDPTKFEVADISKTSVCPLARVIRQELKKRRIKNVKVVFSTEKPLKPQKSNETTVKHQIPGSNAFCPSVMGLIIASEVIIDLINNPLPFSMICAAQLKP